MGKIDVSVIIPTYNRATYLADSLNSVINQTEPNCTYEIIVVDDGSTDDTKRVLEDFKDHIRYIKIKNSGLPAIPRNVGLHLAQGELIAFQDSDDLWVANKLHDQVPIMDDPEIILSSGNAEIMDAHGAPTGKVVNPEGFGKSGRVFNDLVENNFIATLTVIVRKSALLAVGGFNESPLLKMEDYELWLRLASLGKFDYTAKTLAHYRSHDENISHSIKAEGNLQLLHVYRSVLKQSISLRQRALLHKRIAATLSSNTKPIIFRVAYERAMAKLFTLLSGSWIK
ncbi:MAG: glycosyltransferase [Candidatus Saccharimonadia bacterium]